MNKEELYYEMSHRTHLPLAGTKKALEVMLEIISEQLSSGNVVKLIGFGTFCVKDASSRVARNPQTMEPIVIPATRKPKFTPGKFLKEAVK